MLRIGSVLGILSTSVPFVMSLFGGWRRLRVGFSAMR